MPTERHLIIYATMTKRAVIDLRELKVTKNTGVPERTLVKVLKALSDENTSLIKWMKPVAK